MSDSRKAAIDFRGRTVRDPVDSGASKPDPGTADGVSAEAAVPPAAAGVPIAGSRRDVEVTAVAAARSAPSGERRAANDAAGERDARTGPNSPNASGGANESREIPINEPAGDAGVGGGINEVPSPSNLSNRRYSAFS